VPVRVDSGLSHRLFFVGLPPPLHYIGAKMEETLPPQTADGAGFERTGVPQFTIFMENRVGRLHALVRLLEEDVGVIHALAIEESADSALVRVVCSNAEQGRTLLRQAGISFSETDVLIVELPRRGMYPLSGICTALLSAEINIHYAYPMMVRPRGPAVALFVEDPVLAAQILIRKGFMLIGESDLKTE
jgi:hypothetical protein